MCLCVLVCLCGSVGEGVGEGVWVCVRGVCVGNGEGVWMGVVVGGSKLSIFLK